MTCQAASSANAGPPSPRLSLWHAAAWLLATWLLFGGAEIALTLLVPTESAQAGPSSARRWMGLVALDLLALGGAIGLFLAPVLGLLCVVETTHTRSRWLRGVLYALLTVLVWGLLFGFCASWGTRWSGGTFIGRETIDFWLPTPLLLMHWVPPLLLYGAPPLSLALAVVLGYGLLRWLKHWREVVLRPFLGIGAVGLVAVTGVAGAWGRGQASAAANQEQTSTGAFGHVWDDVRGGLSVAPATPLRSPRIQTTTRPIIAMQQYAAQITPGQCKNYNVIILLVESLRPDQLRVFGSPRDVMPNLDAVATQARCFSHHYAQATHSNYADLCPLSSHYPLRSASPHTYPEHPTYPRVLIYDVLKAIGYRTAIFSSQNEHWGAMYNYLNTGSLDHFLHAETFKGPVTGYAPTDTGFAEWVAQTKHAGKIDDRYTVQEAIQWISQSEQPFCIYMNLQTSHFPYRLPEGVPHRFGPAEIDFEINFGYYPQEQAQVVKDLYADSLYYLDQQIGKLIEGLKTQGKWDQTILVVCGDNGQAFWEHGMITHGKALIEEVVRVPLIVRAPGLTVAGADDRPAQAIDVPPSVLHLLGLPAHPAMQGLNLFDTDRHERRSIFLLAQTPLAHQYAIVHDGRKLILQQRAEVTRLYDLRQDPREEQDLADSQPQLVSELRERLDTWRAVQLDYYADPVAQRTYYPPVLRDD